MPRAIARISREKRLRTLAQNLFVVEGPNRQADLRRAERALLRDNPWLADPEQYRAGAVVLVPLDLGLRTTPRVEVAAADLEGLMQEAIQRLKMTETLIRDGLGRSLERNEKARAQLEDQAFRRELQRSSPEAAKLVPAATKSVAEALERNQKLESELSQAIGAGIEQIEQLRKMAGKER